MRETTWAGENPTTPKDASIAGILSAPLSVSPLPVTSPLEGIEEMPTKRLCTRRQLTERPRIILLLRKDTFHRADVKADNCLQSISLSRFNRCTQEREIERVTEFHSCCKSSEEILIIVGKRNLQQ